MGHGAGGIVQVGIGHGNSETSFYSHCPLPIAHRPIPIAHCPLPIALNLQII
ncbi:hypothetical protein [Tolypothrix sp. VBCCA 56010]|uniref:hypothetical protein n=1 Tax=Tolypothrix sp. VBCCA 56010 TaxID=3137731 RepID=UPI003D7E3224